MPGPIRSIALARRAEVDNPPTHKRDRGRPIPDHTLFWLLRFTTRTQVSNGRVRAAPTSVSMS